MKACAIIAEYNPFHNGHAWHIQQAKEQSGADIIIAIMSGNFVQRGEVAIVDKWQRTEVALKNGVDIVIELPTLSAIQSADYFGLQAVKIADALQVDYLAFGCEQPEQELLEQIAQQIEHIQSDDLTFLNTYHTNIQNYIQRELGQKASQFMQLPNNQLALAYTRALLRLSSRTKVLPIQRQQVLHTDKQLNREIAFASGTAIRQAVFAKENIEQFVPNEMSIYLKSIVEHDDMWWQILKYCIIAEPLDVLKQYAFVEEGIEHRLKKKVFLANDYTDFVEKMMSKRWRRARIQRMCLAIVLHILKKDVAEHFKQPVMSLRALGYTDKGREYLKTLENIEIITQFKQKTVQQYQKQIQYDLLYNVLTQQKNEQNFRRIIRL